MTRRSMTSKSFSRVLSSVTLRVAVLVTLCLIVSCQAPRTKNIPATVKRSVPPLARPAQPNVIILVIDTLRYDATSVDPSLPNTTPFLRELVRRSVSFDNAYSTFDSTPASHFSLLTGFVAGWHTAIDRQDYSVAHQLRSLGYSSVGVSANGNLSRATMSVIQAFQNYDCLYDDWLKLPAPERERLLPNIDAQIRSYGGRVNDFNLFCSAPRVLAALEKKIQSAKPPFLAFANILEPHDPYFPDATYYDRAVEESGRKSRDVDADVRFRHVASELLHPDTINNKARRDTVLSRLRRADGRAWCLTDHLSKHALATYRSRYGGEVRAADAHLRSFFQFLEDEHYADSTIVIVTSDHGESFGEGGLITHSFNNEGDRESTHRVPLLIAFPRSFQIAPKRIASLVSIADVAPTIYDLVGMDWRNVANQSTVGNFGKSLLPYIFGQEITTYPLTASTSTGGNRRDSTRESIQRLRSLGYLH